MHVGDIIKWATTPAGLLFLGWLFSTIVAGAPEPKAGSVWYAWLYNTLQRIAANHSLTMQPPPIIQTTLVPPLPQLPPQPQVPLK